MQSLVYLQGKVHELQMKDKEFKLKQFILLKLVLHCLILSTKSCTHGFYISVPVVVFSRRLVPALYIL